MIHAEPPRRFRLVAALASVAVIAAGCGGGDEETTEPAEDRLSQEEYIAQVRETISPIATQSEQLIVDVNEAGSIRELAGPLGDAEEVYREAADGLEEMAPPEEVEDLHAELVESHQNIADAAESAQEAARKGDRQELRAFRRAGEEYRERADELRNEFSERGYQF